VRIADRTHPWSRCKNTPQVEFGCMSGPDSRTDQIIRMPDLDAARARTGSPSRSRHLRHEGPTPPRGPSSEIVSPSLRQEHRGDRNGPGKVLGVAPAGRRADLTLHHAGQAKCVGRRPIPVAARNKNIPTRSESTGSRAGRRGVRSAQPPSCPDVRPGLDMAARGGGQRRCGDTAMPNGKCRPCFNVLVADRPF